MTYIGPTYVLAQPQILPEENGGVVTIGLERGFIMIIWVIEMLLFRLRHFK